MQNARTTWAQIGNTKRKARTKKLIVRNTNTNTNAGPQKLIVKNTNTNTNGPKKVMRFVIRCGQESM